MRRLLNVFRCFSAVELLLIIYHHFIRKDLNKRKTYLHHALITVIHCSDNDFQLKCREGEMEINFESNGNRLTGYLRENTSDFFVFNQIFIRKDYEFLLQRMKLLLPADQNMIIIDAGANTGLAALCFYSVFEFARIICVEPEKSNFTMLEKNIAANNIKNYLLKKAALWNVTANLVLRNDFRNQSNMAFRVEAFANNKDSDMHVEAYTVPQLTALMDGSEIALLKMDIEGAEKILFKDKSCLENFLPKTRFLAVEVHEEMISEAEVIATLQEFDFVCEKTGEYVMGINQAFLKND